MWLCNGEVKGQYIFCLSLFFPYIQSLFRARESDQEDQRESKRWTIAQSTPGSYLEVVCMVH